MPDDFQLQLANEDFTDPRAVAQKADALWLAKTQSSSISINTVTSQNKKANDDLNQNWCYYDTKFGEEKKKCKPPCADPNAGTVSNVPGTAHPHTPLLYLKDVSGGHFLVDTGALISILPTSSRDRRSGKLNVL